MNRYLVFRHIKGAGHDSTTNYTAYADSERQAISQTRYSTTACDSMPNGELTDYTRADGAHIWWTAELVEGKEPTKAPELEDVLSIDEVMAEQSLTMSSDALTSRQIAEQYMKENPDSYKNINSAIGTVNNVVRHLNIARVGDSFPPVYAPDDVKRIHAYMKDNAQGKHINAPITRARKSQPVDEDLTREFFALPDELEKRLDELARFIGYTREQLIYCAVKGYVKRLGSMTLDELISKKEAYND